MTAPAAGSRHHHRHRCHQMAKAIIFFLGRPRPLSHIHSILLKFKNKRPITDYLDSVRLQRSDGGREERLEISYVFQVDRMGDAMRCDCTTTDCTYIISTIRRLIDHFCITQGTGGWTDGRSLRNSSLSLFIIERR